MEEMLGMIIIKYEGNTYRGITNFINTMHENGQFLDIGRRTIENLVYSSYLPRGVYQKYPDLSPLNGKIEFYKGKGKSLEEGSYEKVKFSRNKLLEAKSKSKSELREEFIENMQLSDERSIIVHEYNSKYKYYEFEGNIYTMSELARELGISVSRLRYYVLNRDSYRDIPIKTSERLKEK